MEAGKPPLHLVGTTVEHKHVPTRLIDRDAHRPGEGRLSCRPKGFLEEPDSSSTR